MFVVETKVKVEKWVPYYVPKSPEEFIYLTEEVSLGEPKDVSLGLYDKTNKMAMYLVNVDFTPHTQEHPVTIAQALLVSLEGSTVLVDLDFEDLPHFSAGILQIGDIEYELVLISTESVKVIEVSK